MRGVTAPGRPYYAGHCIIRSEAMTDQRRPALRFEAVRGELRAILLAFLMVALTTIVAWILHKYLDVRRGSAIYLLPVLLAACPLGRWPARVAATAAVPSSRCVFYPPYYTCFMSG